MKLRLFILLVFASLLLGCPNDKHSEGDGHDHGKHSKDDGHDHSKDKKSSKDKK